MMPASPSSPSVSRGSAEDYAPRSPAPGELPPRLQSLFEESTQIIQDTFRRFPPAEIGVAFNGGKDSIVMFELLRAVVAPEVLTQCCIFTVELRDEFEELREFRVWYMQVVARGLPLVHEEVTDDMRLSLWKLTERRPLKAVFMGTRQSDPHGRYQKGAVEKTTAGWPDFLRTCPLFHWTVDDVWAYTRIMRVPQCNLYECGYSSLGNVSSTRRNPLLQQPDGTFKPAWVLKGDSAERSGRDAA